MTPLQQSLQEKLQTLPKKPKPKDFPTIDDADGLSLYMVNNRRILYQKILTDIPEWIVLVTGKTITMVGDECDGTYETPEGYYKWCWIRGTKAESHIIAKDFIDSLYKHTRPFNTYTKVGLLCVLQEQVIEIDIDYSLKCLFNDGQDTSLEDYINLYKYRENIGNTLDILSPISLSKWNDAIKRQITVQTFLTPQKTGTVAINDDKSVRIDRIKQLDSYIKKGANVFIHAAYHYNPADIKSNEEVIISDLREAVKVGCKGLVMHVGHSPHNTSLPMNVFSQRMVTNIRKILHYATENTPLLLETPSGKQNELLCTLKEFSDFYLEFTPEEQKIFGLCIDTCHVWDSGYHPLTYIEYIQRRLPGALRLIHFNDSQGECGCRNDIHMTPGGNIETLKQVVTKCEKPTLIYPGQMGNIGIQRLCQVATWASLHNITCIMES